MVTFRFYLVSTVAFFLALAVGVLVGSVLDGRIADGLQTRLDRVETSLDETVVAMDAKNVEIDQLSDYVEASAPYAVQGSLDATSTLVVAESGIDGASVEDLVRRLRESGSRVEGIVWLDPRWDLSSTEDLAAAASLAGTNSSSPERLRAALWQRFLDVAPGGDTSGSDPSPTTSESTTSVVDPATPSGSVTTLAPPTTGTTTTTVVPATPLFESATLRGMAEAGLVRLQLIDGDDAAPGGDLLVVAATGTASTLAEPGVASTQLVRQAADAGVAAVLAEATARAASDAEPERGSLVAAALDQGSVRFSTVDDLEVIPGRVASVLALADARVGLFGRFGIGPDVDGVLPAWKGP